MQPRLDTPYRFARAFDDEGVVIEKELDKLKEGDVYQLDSTGVSGIVKVREISKVERKESGRTIYIFDIALQLIA
jgi:hypothetical protein